MDDLARLINAKNSIRYCESCGNKMTYAAVHGTYTCPQCGSTFKDTYGRMKDLLEENPNLSMIEISLMLDVPLREIRTYVHDGVLGNPKMDQSS